MSDTSLLGYKWQILNNDNSLSILERLLRNRGVLNDELQQDYLNPDFNKLHDPFLLDDMAEAVKRIQKAIKNQERIIIFGDYDVDGVTGTAILVLGLLDLEPEFLIDFHPEPKMAMVSTKKSLTKLPKSTLSFLSQSTQVSAARIR